MLKTHAIQYLIFYRLFHCIILLACTFTQLHGQSVSEPHKFSYYMAIQDSQPLNSVIKNYRAGKFDSLEGSFANFGRTKTLYWIHFNVSGKEKIKDYLLEIDNSHIYDIKVFRVDKNASATLLYHTGINQKFRQRPYPSRNFVFPIRISEGQTADYFVSLDRRSEVLKFNINLVDRKEYLFHQNWIYWFYGCFAGILIFIMMFNIFLQVTLNDLVHTWYTLYILFILLFVLADTGLGYEFFWGTFPELNKHIRTFTGLGAFFLQLQFMQLFITQTANNSRVYRAVNWSKKFFLCLIFFAVLPLILNFQLPPWALSAFNTLFTLAYISGIILVGLSLAEKIYSKNRTGLIYLLAIVPLMIQVMVVLLSRWHLLSMPIDTSLTMALSILVEIIILTLGLTIRYNYFKVEKDKLEHSLALQQQHTLEKVLSAQEGERRRVAGDLHDDLGGTLSSIKGLLSGIGYQNDNSSREMIANSQKLLDKACEDLRFIAHDLMPTDFSNTKLHLAIGESISKLNSSSDIEFNYIYVGIYRQFDKYLELNIYRILNELLHNIRKHSRAKHAVIQLIYHEDFLQLMVEDNGCGFDANKEESAAGIGLKNIQSRIEYINGKIYFDSNNQGTTVTCNVPYPI